MPRRYETLEIIRQKKSMSQGVAQKDQDYSLYAGAELSIAYQMALIDVLLKNKIFPKKYMPLIKFYRSYLNQKRKAFFSAISSEITKLGFMLGYEDDTIKVSRTNTT